MNSIRVLLVDDDEIVRMSLTCVLEQNGCSVVVAANVAEALKHISSAETYDVLLSDLHMPGAGDGLTVVSAMRHANPRAVTVLISAFPEMNAATQAILLQADEILVKPLDLGWIGGAIHRMFLNGPVRGQGRVTESVGLLIERTAQDILHDWFESVQKEESLAALPVSYETRSAPMVGVLRDIVARLNAARPGTAGKPFSHGCAQYGSDRFKQGYAPAKLVEEMRLLQLSIFHTLQANLASIDFNLLMVGMIAIADEIQAQLGQAVASYFIETLPSVGRARDNDAPRTGSYLHA